MADRDTREGAFDVRPWHDALDDEIDAEVCTCTPDESSNDSATFEDDPDCPIHGGRF